MIGRNSEDGIHPPNIIKEEKKLSKGELSMSSISKSEQVIEWIHKNREKVSQKSVNDELNTITAVTDIYRMPWELLQIHQPTKESEVRASTATVLSEAKTLRLTCLTCQITFTTAEQQHEHFKCDLHILNVKRKMRGEAPLSFVQADGENNTAKSDAVDGETDDAVNDESDSTDDEATVGKDEMETADAADQGDEVVKKEFVDQFGTIRKVFSHTQGPQFIAMSTTLAPLHYSFSSAILRSSSVLAQRNWTYESDLWSHLQADVDYVRQRPFMAVFVLRSGRFAGAIFNNANTKAPLVVHKVIRRYTVRAKAGGGQSSHDNKSGKAKSMGAQLRRYGEQALQEDVERILTSWSDYLGLCGIILVAATKTMRGVLFEKDERDALASKAHLQLLQKDDTRVVFVPFAVDKPTLETVNLIRDRSIAVTLSTAPILSAEEVMDTGTAKAAVQESNSTKKPATAVSNGGETAEPDPQETLLQQLLSHPLAARVQSACLELSDEAACMVLRTVASELGVFNVTADDVEVENNEGVTGSESAHEELSRLLRLPNNLQELSTPLHVATDRSLTQTVQLLLQFGASPEAQDARGRSPYFLARQKDMRDLFRRMRAELGEDRWQWTKAGVPEPLTDEKLAQQKQKEKDKKKRAQQRKKEQKAKAEQEAIDAELARKLQEEMRVQQQKENEERMRLAAGSCVICKKSLYGQEFYDVFEQRCCSTACVQRFRRQLAADAAQARMLAQKK